jgi:hypothetical protein
LQITCDNGITAYATVSLPCNCRVSVSFKLMAPQIKILKARISIKILEAELGTFLERAFNFVKDKYLNFLKMTN